MGINNYEGFEDGEVISSSSEQASEQYKEKSKKAQIQLKKIQKDEKKAQGDNHKLFLILSRFIQDNYYNNLISDVSFLLSEGLPSRGVIAFIALFYPDATFYVADSIGKKEKMKQLLSLPRYSEKIPFNEKNIHKEILTWISEWIVLMDIFLIHEESSLVMTKKFLEIIHKKNANIEKILAHFLVFFFQTRNIIFPQDKAVEYSRFIIKNIYEKLYKYIQSQEKIAREMIEDIELTSDDLIGL